MKNFNKTQRMTIHAFIRATVYSLLILLAKSSPNSPLIDISWWWVLAPFALLIGAYVSYILYQLLMMIIDDHIKNKDKDNDPPVPPTFVY